ncbi:hypothetical protein [Streptomyces sp. NPDC056707]|uniref:hypothetical protein n=1 Tax=Streptomyces sp. NPDC056707 TaxID=3345919 RepID=UPI0036A9E69C
MTARIEAAQKMNARDLYDGWLAGSIDTATVRALAGPVWSWSEEPESGLSHTEWRTLFDTAGYTIDGEPSRRPRKPITLWRGCRPRWRTCWSWTADKSSADWFACEEARMEKRDGLVYQVTAPPQALLARNTHRGESEYILDPTGLVVTEVPRDIESVMFSVCRSLLTDRSQTLGEVRERVSVVAWPQVHEALIRLVHEGFVYEVPRSAPTRYMQLAAYPWHGAGYPVEQMTAWRRRQRSLAATESRRAARLRAKARAFRETHEPLFYVGAVA